MPDLEGWKKGDRIQRDRLEGWVEEREIAAVEDVGGDRWVELFDPRNGAIVYAPQRVLEEFGWTKN